MKKLLLTLVILLAGLSARAQVFPFGEVNTNTYTVGFQMGAVGMNQNYSLFAAGANMTIWGLYLDFLVHEAEHRYTYHRGFWDDNRAYSMHVGYQIPITRWLRIIPMLGYGEVSGGVTNSYDTRYDYREDSWVNHYEPDWRTYGLDPGASLVLNFGIVNLYLTATQWSACAGIGIEF